MTMLVIVVGQFMGVLLYVNVIVFQFRLTFEQARNAANDALSIFSERLRRR
jgi:hypothetical protein